MNTNKIANKAEDSTDQKPNTEEKISPRSFWRPTQHKTNYRVIVLLSHTNKELKFNLHNICLKCGFGYDNKPDSPIRPPESAVLPPEFRSREGVLCELDFTLFTKRFSAQRKQHRGPQGSWCIKPDSSLKYGKANDLLVHGSCLLFSYDFSPEIFENISLKEMAERSYQFAIGKLFKLNKFYTPSMVLILEPVANKRKIATATLQNNERIFSTPIIDIQSSKDEQASGRMIRIWVNPVPSGNIRGAAILESLDSPELDTIMDVVAANGTIRSALNRHQSGFTGGGHTHAEDLIHSANMVGELQLHLGRESYSRSLNSEFMDTMINLFVDDQTVDRVYERLSTRAQLEAMTSQNETMISIQTLIASQGEVLKATRAMATAQHELLLSQEKAKEWAGRFGLVAASIAIIISTSALFAGLAAIPKPLGGRLEPAPALNLSLTIVASGAALSFTLILLREGVKSVAQGWMMRLALCFVALATVLGIWAQISRHLGWWTVIGLGTLLLTASVIATIYIRRKDEKERAAK